MTSHSSQRPWALPLLLSLALAGTLTAACNMTEAPPPEATSSTEQALCSADTHCEFYTDASHATLCGERDSCIDCSTSNSQWGCVTSTYRQCWTLANCSTKYCWVCNGVDCSWQICGP